MNKFQNDECVKERIRHPKMYAVIFWNDHVTTAEFVIEALVKVFSFDFITAKKKMTEVDTLGQSRIGVFPRDIAETKRDEVLAMAKQQKMPFKVTTEIVDDEEEDY